MSAPEDTCLPTGAAQGETSEVRTAADLGEIVEGLGDLFD